MNPSFSRPKGRDYEWGGKSFSRGIFHSTLPFARFFFFLSKRKARTLSVGLERGQREWKGKEFPSDFPLFFFHSVCVKSRCVVNFACSAQYQKTMLLHREGWGEGLIFIYLLLRSQNCLKLLGGGVVFFSFFISFPLIWGAFLLLDIHVIQFIS